MSTIVTTRDYTSKCLKVLLWIIIIIIIIIIITSTSDLQPSTAIANQLPGH